MPSFGGWADAVPPPWPPSSHCDRPTNAAAPPITAAAKLATAIATTPRLRARLAVGLLARPGPRTPSRAASISRTGSVGTGTTGASSSVLVGLAPGSSSAATVLPLAVRPSTAGTGAQVLIRDAAGRRTPRGSAIGSTPAPAVQVPSSSSAWSTAPRSSPRWAPSSSASRSIAAARRRATSCGTTSYTRASASSGTRLRSERASSSLSLGSRRSRAPASCSGGITRQRPSVLTASAYDVHFGGVAERLNAPALKAGGGLGPSWVRIPPPPPQPAGGSSPRPCPSELVQHRRDRRRCRPRAGGSPRSR